MAFANNIENPEGGTHVTGFKTSLTRSLNNYARKNGIVKESEDNFTGDDVLEGLTAVVSVKIREIQFEGQTKAKLGSVEAAVRWKKSLARHLGHIWRRIRMMPGSIISKAILALAGKKSGKSSKGFYFA